ncbi:uncharacterized protein LOC116766556 [Danaus plexippus]|uniref:uncharacterized protein LOC116766556 n=1 Tax=Danaus plexippus TaxID=13037 RepID=UPI002AB15F2F|nr:uncharacterized protein LOC116766556 [Danaus plexippus]
MPSKFCLLKLFSSRSVIKGTDLDKSRICKFYRNYADSTKVESTSKQVMVQGTADDPVLRVRRARPADITRVIRFVKDNVRLAWPGLVNQNSTSNHVVMSDFVARTLAQGHSMLAEQQEGKRGWSQIRGVAINTCVCPWDASLLEKWAKCVRCIQSKKMMLFTAHCLRAPELHDKYRVQNILQVILLVPPDSPRSAEVVYMLAKKSIHRGRELGFPLLRFDVTDEPIAKILEHLQLKREYAFNYEVLPADIRVYRMDLNKDEKSSNEKKETKKNYVTVYTAFPGAEKI